IIIFGLFVVLTLAHEESESVIPTTKTHISRSMGPNDDRVNKQQKQEQLHQEHGEGLLQLNQFIPLKQLHQEYGEGLRPLSQNILTWRGFTTTEPEYSTEATKTRTWIRTTTTEEPEYSREIYDVKRQVEYSDIETFNARDEPYIPNGSKMDFLASMSTITLVSSDRQIFEIDSRIVECMGTIKHTMKNAYEDNDPIPLPNVDSATLKKVLEWADHHKDDPVSIQDDAKEQKRTDDITDWDREFLKVDHHILFAMILAANYLDMSQLLEITSKTVANMLKGKTADEIRTMLHIEDDLTKEEKAELRKGNELK
ncbi:S-phase kinase-associated protein 1, partial [Pseudolycoriella hygida]